MTNKSEEAVIRPVAHIRTDFSSKFGIPRQSGLVPETVGEVVFEPEFSSPEALREISSFSHIWLIWQFSQCVGSPWHATVRPPRLGGNRRVGVFASRSPFRPNNLGFSCVKLIRVTEQGTLIVSGADILDGTPVFDIKPYIPVADCHPEALDGYTDETKGHKLTVTFPEELSALVPEDKRKALSGVLANDPRPGYEDDPEREYGLVFAGLNVIFFVSGNSLRVAGVEKCENTPDAGQNG